MVRVAPGKASADAAAIAIMAAEAAASVQVMPDDAHTSYRLAMQMFQGWELKEWEEREQDLPRHQPPGAPLQQCAKECGGATAKAAMRALGAPPTSASAFAPAGTVAGAADRLLERTTVRFAEIGSAADAEGLAWVNTVNPHYTTAKQYTKILKRKNEFFLLA